MSLLFVTGSDAGYFNTLLIGLQSFAERFPGQKVVVCDYGFTPAQAEFLRERGQWAERPPEIPEKMDVLLLKSAMGRYLSHAGYELSDYDAVVWVDCDITFLDVGIADYEAVVRVMQERGALVAACRDISNISIQQLLEFYYDNPKIAPFEEALSAYEVDRNRPYISVGIVFCRSAKVLADWQTMTAETTPHMLFEQNMFNVLLARDGIPALFLDSEEWQLYGALLDQVTVQADGGRSIATLNGKRLRALHTSSPYPNHVEFISADIAVQDVHIEGMFKLFINPSLRLILLKLLAAFVHQQQESLLRLGLCRRHQGGTESFQFSVNLPA